MNRFAGPIVLLILLVATLLAVALCSGCSQYQGPSAVHGDIARVQANVQQAQGHTDQLSRQNARAAELARRIRDKDVLSDRWNETHR